MLAVLQRVRVDSGKIYDSFLIVVNNMINI